MWKHVNCTLRGRGGTRRGREPLRGGLWEDDPTWLLGVGSRSDKQPGAKAGDSCDGAREIRLEGPSVGEAG